MCLSLAAPEQNANRYEVQVSSQIQGQTVFYRLSIEDLALSHTFVLDFRFREVRKLHKMLLKKSKTVPSLPPTNGFAFWHRTNKCHRRIEERRREL